jgi:hypothetical protein
MVCSFGLCPFRQPGRLVTLTFNQSGPNWRTSPGKTGVSSGLGGLGLQAADSTNGGEPQQWEVGFGAGVICAVLGRRRPRRLWQRTMTAYGGRPVLMLSYEIWQKQFAGDPGRGAGLVTLAGQTITVVGVTASGFRSTRGALSTPYTPYRVFYPLAARSRGAHHARGLCPAPARPNGCASAK